MDAEEPFMVCGVCGGHVRWHGPPALRTRQPNSKQWKHVTYQRDCPGVLGVCLREVFSDAEEAVILLVADLVGHQSRIARSYERSASGG